MTDFAPTIDRLATVARVFTEAGRELHLVGGMVRDLILGLPAAGDFDLTTDARPAETLALVRPLATAVWEQGARFGTIGARVEGADLEITTYRSESYNRDSRKPEVRFGDDLATDLSRRDFTINAMAVDVLTGALADPFGGAEDLAERRLRTPLAPDISFTDDPLRMLRAARFIPRFDLAVDASLARAASDHAHRLAIVSAERIREELERLLAVDRPRAGMTFLADHDLVHHVVPGIERPAWDRAAEQMSTTRDVGARRALLVASLGPGAAGELMDRLRYSRAEASTTVRLLEVAGRAKRLQAVDSNPADSSSADSKGQVLTDEALRRLVDSAGKGAEPLVVDRALFLDAVMSGRSRPTALDEALADLRSREDLTDLAGPLSGGQIMAELGLEPGPAVGEASARLKELRLRQGPLSQAEALAALRRDQDHGALD